MYGGIFSYITDGSTAISYRHSDKIFEYKIGSSKFKDYSKNWRQLLYIDTRNYGFVASRQYPSYNEEISKFVREMLEGIIADKLNIENIWKSKEFESSSVFSEYLTDIGEPLHYNDMLHGYKGKIIWNKELGNIDKIHINVGSYAICPICGVSPIYDPGLPTCRDCYDEYIDC